MRVLIRADSGSIMGTGHLRRSINLAYYLSKRHDVEFATKIFPGSIVDVIPPSYKVHPIDASTCRIEMDHKTWLGEPHSKDLEKMTQILLKNRYDWLIIDNYAMDSAYMLEIYQYVDKILVVDDTADRTLYCNKILNYGIDPNNERIQDVYITDLVMSSHRFPCDLHLGLDYFFINPKFTQKSHDVKTYDNGIKNIMVTMGGADPNNDTMRILKVLRNVIKNDESRLKAEMEAAKMEQSNPSGKGIPFQGTISALNGILSKITLNKYKSVPTSDDTIEMINLKSEIRVDVIVGGSCQKYDEIKKFCESNCNSEYFTVYHNVSNMEDFYTKADLCIGGAGVSQFERIYFNLPSIVIQQAINQKMGLDYLKEQSSSLLFYLGTSDDKYEEYLEGYLSTMNDEDFVQRMGDISHNCYSFFGSNDFKCLESILDVDESASNTESDGNESDGSNPNVSAFNEDAERIYGYKNFDTALLVTEKFKSSSQYTQCKTSEQ